MNPPLPARIRPVFLFCCAAAALCGQTTLFIEPTAAGGAPQMPALVFNLDSVKNRGVSNVIFNASSEHARRGKKDDIALSVSSGGVWDVNTALGGKIFGGKIIILPDNAATPLKTLSVRGHNPKDEDVRAFIEAQAGEHWYAAAVAQHESRQRNYVFNQFNSSYYKPTIAGVPNCGLPDGWGIMQIDSKRGAPITTEEVYDWRANVRGGLAVMTKARAEAKAYFDAVKRTFPDKWVEPPAFITVGRTQLSYLDACVIQLYNGASVVRRLKTPYGSYSYYRSAFVFDEKASKSKRWRFKPNVNDYVQKVVSHEIEGALKTQNEPIP